MAFWRTLLLLAPNPQLPKLYFCDRGRGHLTSAKMAQELGCPWTLWHIFAMKPSHETCFVAHPITTKRPIIIPLDPVYQSGSEARHIFLFFIFKLFTSTYLHTRHWRDKSKSLNVVYFHRSGNPVSKRRQWAAFWDNLSSLRQLEKSKSGARDGND